MAREILFNAFEMNCVVHQSPGLWRHRDDRSADYKKLSAWLDLARTLERGLFDAVFIADVLGIYDVYGGSPAAALEHGIQVPANDPLLLVPAMAAVTEHLGFGVTVNLSFEHPFTLARRFSTLDHLTGGRVGWNIVTGYLESASKAFGAETLTDHDTRYEIAEEYVSLVYRLWMESWQEGAARFDRAGSVVVDPGKIERILHDGKYFRLNAIHLCEPSPQRVPLIFQAGTSPAGRAFAGRHAEGIFVSGPTAGIVQRRVRQLREEAERQGRGDDALRIFSLATIITDETDAKAVKKAAEYARHADPTGALVLASGWTGVNFSGLDPRSEVQAVENNAGRSALENLTQADPERSWTVEEVGRHLSIGGVGPVFVGSPQRVADALEDWVEQTGVDGFNLTFAVRPETHESIVDLIVPELQRRGRYKTSYAQGTLRQKLFGAGAHPDPRHPAGKNRAGLTAPA
ncbi:LLM class flavin-dependent oxidoreductase [Aestuariivirga sp.]|uniref:LLM class flavin-dependent oxidoreductase n=1 Tax=Aestuariivirga sp. TaxID=2650926 RepID=UPI0039E4178C